MNAQALLKVAVESLVGSTRSQIYAYDKQRQHAVLTVRNTDIIEISRNRSFLRQLARYGLNAEEADPTTLCIFEDGGTFTAVVMYRKLKNTAMLFVEIS